MSIAEAVPNVTRPWESAWFGLETIKFDSLLTKEKTETCMFVLSWVWILQNNSCPGKETGNKL